MSVHSAPEVGAPGSPGRDDPPVWPHDRRVPASPVVTSRWPSSRWRTAIIMIVSVLLGLLAFSLTLIGALVRPPGAGPTPEELAGLIRQMVVTSILGISALIALPLALRHGEGEARSADAVPGPRSALIAGIVAIMAGMPSEIGFVAAAVALISLVSRRSITWTVAAVTALVIGMVLNFLIQPILVPVEPHVWLISTGVFVVCTLIALGIGLVRGQRRERHWRLVERAEASESFVHARESAARADERLRISRDMHDSLSHRLSLIAVHAGAVEYREDLDPETVRRELGTIREQSELAVEDLRAVLSALREEACEVDPRTSIDRLVDAARLTGMEVELEVDPALGIALAELPTLTAHAVHRMVQECLTNARKHAPGRTVTLHLERTASHLVIRASNPLDAAASTPAEPGFGLVGLGERARLLGGSLAVERGPDTLIVTLTVPWTEQP